MHSILCALLLLASLAPAQSPPRVVEAFREFGRIGAQPLWPGFDPRTIPVEVFDGTDTYLFHHPKPPEGFRPLEGVAGVFVFPGQHDTVRANTGTEVNGVPTATADISKGQGSPAEVASLFIHESFHVFQGKAHPKWGGNEMELFTYPLDDADQLWLRRLETMALVHALQAKSDSDSHHWVEAALGYRQERFAKLPAGAVGYERGSELKEGLAQYVEYLSIQKPAALSPEDFPAGIVRQRAYATGQALALLLDRFGGEWKTQLDSGTSLDELLRARLGPGKKPYAIPKKEAAAQLLRAQSEVEQLVAGRAKRKQDFLAAPGWRLEFMAGKEPLWPQGFDPWNLSVLSSREVLHTRWLKLGNGSGAVEVLNHASMTQGAGAHPIFNGIRWLRVTGLPEPKVTEADGKVTIEAGGIKGSFAAATIERSDHAILIKLP